MLTVIIVGLAMGTTVMIGQAIGAGKKEKVAKVIGNTVTMFMIASVLLMGLALALTDFIVKWTGIPEEAVIGTTQYLRICFIGIPFITAYNIISAIFRGLGDSRSPMIFIGIACAANIGLDYLFMGAMNMGPAGAALGTTLAQTLSVIVSLIAIRRRKTGIVSGLKTVCGYSAANGSGSTGRFGSVDSDLHCGVSDPETAEQ